MTMVPIRQIDTMAFLLAASLTCAQPFSAYVCDPDRGRLLVIRDSYPAANP